MKPHAERPRLRLDHVGIAVGDLDAARERWERVLDLASSEPENVASQAVSVSFLETAGSRVELVASASEDSAIARYLERRPEGLHHLSFELDGVDIDAWFEALRARGVRVLGDAPHDGADGKRVFFVHPEATGGVLIEISQRSPGGAT